jgi:hypothetical protein
MVVIIQYLGGIVLIYQTFFRLPSILLRHAIFTILFLPLNFLQFNADALAASRSSEARVNSLADSTKWTPEERWAFRQICAGRVADLAARYPSDASKESQWPQRRVLTSRFLETILLKEPYRGFIARNGVHISGGWFKEKLDLAGARVTCPLRLDASRLDGGVDFTDLHTDYSISLAHSTVIGKATMNGLQTGISLILQEATMAAVSLVDAQIGTDLNLANIILTGEFDAETMHVGGIMLAAGGKFADVVLRGAKVDNQLVMDESVVSGKLDMQDIQVAHSLLMREIQLNGNAQLLYARVGGQLDFSGYQVEPHDPTCGGGAATKPDTKFKTGFKGSGLPGVLDLTGAAFKGGGLPGVLDLTGAHIGAALLFGSCKRRAPRWQKYSWLILRNVSVGALQDRNENCTVSKSACRDAWPPHLVLDGLTYDQLSALNSGEDSNMASRGSDWWVSWLTREQKYSSQPYQQVASVLRKLGYPEDASDVLYAGKNRELQEATSVNKIVLFLLWSFIGYGYHIYYSLLWALFFILFGAIVLRVTGEGPRNGMPYGLTYSFDMLLPFVSLRERDSKIALRGWAAYYFYIHKVIGFVLGSFLIAGVAGLTK